MRFSSALVFGAYALFGPHSLPAQETPLHGTVFVDANGNGVRDPGERALAGVAVSNQRDVVVTDSLGRFQIATGPSGVVFVSVPDGYRAGGTFWRATSASAGTSVDFPLERVSRVTTFTFVHASDTHIAPASVDRTRRLRALADSLHPSFVLIAGDLVKDALAVQEPEARSYYDLFKTETRQFQEPVWTVPGNHENFGAEPSRSHVSPSHPLYGRGMYHSYFGPDYYSFTFGGVHFIGLNTVSLDDSAYYGDVDSLQLVWLRHDLEHVPADMPVVTFDHIPLVSGFENLAGYIDMPLVSSIAHVRGQVRFRHTVGNTPEVIEALKGHHYVLALGAHIHAGEKLVYQINGEPTRFEQSPAVIGPGQIGSWTFPSGFTLYTVRDGKIDAGRFIPLDPAPSASIPQSKR